MPPRLTVKPWRPSRHRTLRLKLNHLFPFCKMEDHVKHSPPPSSSSSSSGSSSAKKTRKRRKRFRGLLLILRRPKWGSSELDKVGELPEFSRLSEKVYPSPVTPAYVKSMARCAARRAGRLEEADDDADDYVGDACKNFERYLVEMIVEGGRLEDLNDVEELLCCWQNLRCPVYVDLVCRFYAEVCEDMLSASHNNEGLSR
ncbi:transcription repressor OFP17-like [Nymphaea colorata]|uniref:OVATE domain-containing protein n=1 Tax=Nymphaea colorata TaxID=210225 RepID=A0A5K1ABE0_9MAGN|nr:transcription repressor OFP17-like [Nymphaea colorata]